MKKLKYNLLVAVLVYSTFVTAQNIKVVYEVKPNIEEQLKKIPFKSLRDKIRSQLEIVQYYSLSQQGNISFYKELNEEEIKEDDKSGLENLSLSGVDVEVQVIEKTKSEGEYRNFDTKELVENIKLYDKPFTIIDKIVDLDWKLTNEEKKIGNFNCKKATTKYNKEDIVAWYTDEIPIPIGPSIYNGLPGLIVKLDTDNNFFNAVSIENLTEDVVIEKPQPNGEIVTQVEFDKIEESKD